MHRDKQYPCSFLCPNFYLLKVIIIQAQLSIECIIIESLQKQKRISLEVNEN
uniref:Uncharacterized protein n=1 Tax=Rhizophora mucronata TaxID=61149 RepID=A0A2P2LKR7_RHIMU